MCVFKSEYEFISCGLYLVVLLHLCEQRFSDVLGAANEAGVSSACLPSVTAALLGIAYNITAASNLFGMLSDSVKFHMQ